MVACRRMSGPIQDLPQVEQWLVVRHMESGAIAFDALWRLIWRHLTPPPNAATRSPAELWLLAVRQFFAAELAHRAHIEQLIEIEAFMDSQQM